MRNNQSGFSLIEAIMAFAVLGLVAVGFLSFTDNHTKIVKSIDANFEVIDFVGQVRLILSQTKACELTLAGLPVSSATNRPLTDIRGATVIPGSSPIAWNNYIYKSVPNTISVSKTVTLTSMEIKYPPTFTGEVELVMHLTRNNQASFGGKEMIRTIPLTIVANPTLPTQIATCFASGAKVANWSSMCASLGGTYDNVTKKCRGLFKVSYVSQVTPGNDHMERLEYNSATREVKIVVY